MPELTADDLERTDCVLRVTGEIKVLGPMTKAEHGADIEGEIVERVLARLGTVGFQFERVEID